MGGEWGGYKPDSLPLHGRLVASSLPRVFGERTLSAFVSYSAASQPINMAAEEKPANVAAAEKVADIHHSEHAEERTQMELVQAYAAWNEEEVRMPKKQLFRQYLPGVIYSMLLSLALVMEGMDVGLINNFFGHPAYLQKFGWPDEDGEMHISAKWQGAIGAGQNCGQIVGLLINGYLQARFGSRKVYMVRWAPRLARDPQTDMAC